MIIIHDQKALSVNFKSSRSQMFSKQVFLKILQYSQTHVMDLLKSESNTDVFLQIFQNFQEHLF